MIHRRIVAVLALLCIAGPVLAETPEQIAKIKDQIWAKELQIYAGRAKGSVTYYRDNASPDFLAWTYGTPKPFRVDNFNLAGKKMEDHEKIENVFKDISVHGDTVILYYVNHRTMMPDGTAVDQTFDNIHVWTRDGNDWKVLASMSRLNDKPK